MKFPPINFKNWIEENRELLKPPVGNKMVWPDREFIVMVVGGPNSRTDYHVNEGEEFFYQIEGDITLKIVEDGKHEDVLIREGEIYLLAGNTPHSPRRPAGTIGLVIERKRLEHEKDGFLWYCENCGEKLFERFIKLKNIEKDLVPVFDAFYGDKAHRECKNCGTIAPDRK